MVALWHAFVERVDFQSGFIEFQTLKFVIMGCYCVVVKQR